MDGSRRLRAEKPGGFGRGVRRSQLFVIQGPKVHGIAPDGSELVVAEFSVDRMGRARHICIVKSADVPEVDLLEWRLVRSLQRAQLRPRIENGQPVKTPNVRYRLVVTNDTDH